MLRYLVLFTIDIINLFIVLFLGYFLMLSTTDLTNSMDVFYSSLLIIIPIKLLFYLLFGLYKTLWRYASTRELLNIFAAVISSTILIIFYILISRFIITTNNVVPIVSIRMLIISSMAEILSLMGTRYVLRYYRRIKRLDFKNNYENRVLIIGVNKISSIVAKDLLNNRTNKIVGYLDKDTKKANMLVRGSKVFGWVEKYEEVMEKYQIDKVLICIPNLNNNDMNFIVSKTPNKEIQIKVIDKVGALFKNPVNVENYLKPIAVQDLLGRAETKLDALEISNFIDDKSVLVTGAGGSIGSEICRQVVKYKPRQLILLDMYEHSVFEVYRDLLEYCNNTKVEIDFQLIIANVQEKVRIDQIFKKFKPEIVYHAAAYKHVPLMEWNPQEAIKNNIVGSYNVALSASKYKAENFVLISTDKAVNPTNVMGATKRFVELIVQSLQKESNTKFSMVRFGNVLGSNGSVIPIFEKQIQKGGPITITDKNMIRYFMTIPEAAQLVIQSGCYAKGGEVFILDMGDPVKIYDLAINMIKLKGLVPGKDVEVIETGIRPGEKMYEELLLDKDQHYRTKNEKIFVDFANLHQIADPHYLIKYINENISNWDEMDIYNFIKSIVPTFYSQRFNEVDSE